jgi:hypothetical protein
MNDTKGSETKSLSSITQLDNLMVCHDIALPSYNFTEQENNQWQVTCTIPRLEIEETVSGSERYEVRELVAEKVLEVVRVKGILDGS